MAEASDARELVEAQAAERDADFFPLNDLPNDVLVSVFVALDDPTWVRYTVPLVCRAWNELYCSKDASPLHETLEVDFEGENGWALAQTEFLEAESDDDEEEEEDEEDEEEDEEDEEDEEEDEEEEGEEERAAEVAAREGGGRRHPVVHASRVIAWAQRRAGSVRKLVFKTDEEILRKPLKDFSSKDFGRLVAVVGPSLTDISVGSGLGRLGKRPFWEALRTSVVPAGRLRSLNVEDTRPIIDESDLEPLVLLAGSLEELELHAEGLQRFPESFCALKKLRRLVFFGSSQITAIPAGISSLKELKDLDIGYCDLSSLPKELGELSGLTRLDLRGNENLGTTLPAAEAFPAELGKMKSLRVLNLRSCGLRTSPSFIGELKSLESLTLAHSDLGTVPAFVSELKSLESLDLAGCRFSSLPKELGELSGLTKLDLRDNRNLGNLPEDEAFPAELRKMKSLRILNLSSCVLRTVPAFVGGLESLETLHLDGNGGLQIDAPLDFLVEGCPRLRHVCLYKNREWPPESQAHFDDFVAKLRAKNPGAKVGWLWW